LMWHAIVVNGRKVMQEPDFCLYNYR
jgi:hypothetical protein